MEREKGRLWEDTGKDVETGRRGRSRVRKYKGDGMRRKGGSSRDRKDLGGSPNHRKSSVYLKSRASTLGRVYSRSVKNSPSHSSPQWDKEGRGGSEVCRDPTLSD